MTQEAWIKMKFKNAVKKLCKPDQNPGAAHFIMFSTLVVATIATKVAVKFIGPLDITFREDAIQNQIIALSILIGVYATTLSIISVSQSEIHSKSNDKNKSIGSSLRGYFSVSTTYAVSNILFLVMVSIFAEIDSSNGVLMLCEWIAILLLSLFYVNLASMLLAFIPIFNLVAPKISNKDSQSCGTKEETKESAASVAESAASMAESAASMAESAASMKPPK